MTATKPREFWILDIPTNKKIYETIPLYSAIETAPLSPGWIRAIEYSSYEMLEKERDAFKYAADQNSIACEILKKDIDKLKEKILAFRISGSVSGQSKKEKLDALDAENTELKRQLESARKIKSAVQNKARAHDDGGRAYHVLSEELAEAKAEIEYQNKLADLQLECSEKEFSKIESELAEARAEIERLQVEVVKRNQYKINQEYLDNTHAAYEAQIQSCDALIEKCREALNTIADEIPESIHTSEIQQLQTAVAKKVLEEIKKFKGSNK